jgi:hypothetical protein
MARTHTTGRQPILLCSLIVLLGLGVGTALGGPGEAPRKGGTLRVGNRAEPPSLDMHWSTDAYTQRIAPFLLPEGL